MKIRIKISADKKKALIFIDTKDNSGPKEITKEGIEKALNNAGIVKGIKPEVINHILINHKYDKDFLIAESIPPGIGKEGRIWVREKPRERSTYDKGIDAEKKVDHFGVREGYLTFVKKDAIIATYIPPSAGVPGYTVKGEEIPGLPGKDVSWETTSGRNTIIDDKNLIATADGLLKKEGHIYNVDTSVEISGDLGLKTGSIILPLESDIELIVHGDIKSGFTAQCRKIVVSGTVEDAKIKAKQLEVGRGIVGNSNQPIIADVIETGFIIGTRRIKAKYLNVTKEISGGSMIESNFVRSNSIQECSLTALYGIWTKYLFGKNNILLGVDLEENEEFKVWSEKLEGIKKVLMTLQVSNKSLLKKAESIKDMVKRRPDNPAAKSELKKLNEAVNKIQKCEIIKRALEKKLKMHQDNMFISGSSFLLVEEGFVKKSAGKDNPKPLNNITIKEFSFDRSKTLIPGIYTVQGEEVVAKTDYSVQKIENIAKKYKEEALKENRENSEE